MPGSLFFGLLSRRLRWHLRFAFSLASAICLRASHVALGHLAFALASALR
ncbi:hypothetical protein K788_0007459 [Paraburkholderia caribensis MBA4]|uniref:Uncharacterized protein n=1 Tax=Paraburkholderia caribensis MBA4 TaxID=1323664 RepID=A0A0P0RBP1_9BURK|nr:hypothetical protein K788_0007459 [Paraburkholderia caribensis MBA4]